MAQIAGRANTLQGVYVRKITPSKKKKKNRKEN